MPGTTLPKDYARRVYAGVLGKIIGVYLGRPFEGWPYAKLTETFGEVAYYVNQHPVFQKKPPLIVTDDDISGTFTFFRALADWGFSKELTAQQIGRCWMNYIIENRTILWWGGLGLSTEHTAYLRMKHGLAAPKSGSIEVNGQVVAEQIGAQIFIDAWGMACPSNPVLAARLAQAAGSVSHDGEAVYGAQVIAAMEAEAFVNPELNHLLDTGVAQIPGDCLIARMIAEIRAWHKQDHDWRKTRSQIEAHYGYDKYGGNCHIIPNHALVILALLYAPDSFSDALKIVNTCGWDTDCNSANVGCIQGIRLGLDVMQKQHDWRSPVADRLFLPTAEPGRCISDAVLETDHIVHAATALSGRKYTPPKNGARWHFSYPGSVQGFLPILNALEAPTCFVTNAPSPFAAGENCLAISINTLSGDQFAGARVNTWFLPDELQMPGYGLIGSPLVFAGQSVQAELMRKGSTPRELQARLAVSYYGEEDSPVGLYSEWVRLESGKRTQIRHKIPDTHGNPVFQLRIEFCGGDNGAAFATVFVDSVRILGTPTTSLITTTAGKPGEAWKKAWTHTFSDFRRPWDVHAAHTLMAVQNEDWGLAAMGTGEWSKYRFESSIKPHLADGIGIGVGYRGLKRFLRLALHADSTARLELHDLAGVKELAQVSFPFELYRTYKFALEWTGAELRASLDGKDLFGSVKVTGAPAGGGVAIFLKEGRAFFTDTRITAL